MDTSSILGLIKTRIEALAPTTQVGADDVFRAYIGTSAPPGRRHILIEATAGRRLLRGGETCDDWETTIELSASYPETRTETGALTVLQVALEDAEDLLADLYTWSTTTDGIIRMDPEIGLATDEGDGSLVVSRPINLVFERS